MNPSWRVPLPGFLFAMIVQVLCLLPEESCAQAQQARSAAASVTSTNSLSSLLQMLFALAVVLGLIALFAWGLRRLSMGRRLGGSVIKIRGGAMLGPKERVVLVEVADTWILVGVGSGQVNALHAMPRPPTAESPPDLPENPPTIRGWMRQNLGQRDNGES